MSFTLSWLTGAAILLVVASPLALAWFVSGFIVQRPPDLPPGVVPEAWATSDPKSLFGLEYSHVEFTTSDGVDVHGWLIPAGDRAPARSAVIFVHGRGGSRRLAFVILEALHASGMAVLAFDTRGHGETAEPTPGAAFVSGWLDVAAAVKFLKEDLGYERVGVIGASQGASSAIMAAGRTGGIDAVVSQSGATSLFGLLRGMQILRWLPDWEISLICRIALLRLGAPPEMQSSPRSGPVDDVGEIAPAPVLIIHGDADDLVAVEEAHALFASAREPKQLWIVPGRDHIDIPEDSDYRSRITSFLSAHLAPKRPHDRSESAALE